MSVTVWPFEGGTSWESPAVSEGGGEAETGRPAPAAGDLIVYFNATSSTIPNAGSAGSLDLTCTDQARYAGLGPYGDSLLVPVGAGAYGLATSGDTTKGEGASFTFWCWNFLKSVPSGLGVYPFWGKHPPGGWVDPYADAYLSYNPDATLHAAVSLGSGVYSVADSESPVSVPALHLLALTYDPAVGLKIYVDGVLAGSDLVNKGAAAWTHGGYALGGQGTQSGGWCGEARVVNRVLTAGELLAIYNTRRTP